MNAKRGFTLIELLVVISIIGLLSSIVLVALNSARTKAYDAQRISNLNNIRMALEVYYAANGSYPISLPAGNLLTTCAGTIGLQVASPSLVIPGLSPTYIGAVPTDPQVNGNKCCYYYQGTATDYKFMFYSCVANSVACTGNPPPSLPDQIHQNACSVYTPGATW